jgi:hypothetical protein
VLIDSDHIVDWALNGGREDYSRRIVVPLHGWEYPLLLLAVGRAPAVAPAVRRALVALAAGWACHLLLDFLVNHPETPAGYLVLRRLRYRFERVRCGWLPPAAWQARYRTTHRPAPGEAAAAAALGCALLLTRPA